MRAKEFIVEYKNQPTEEYGGLQFRMIEGDDHVTVNVFDSSGTMELGHVTFDIMDDMFYDLDPQDLFIKPQYQGQGIAKIMYDFVKSHGYRINRSYDQTDAGAHFWEKNRGDERVWEEVINELRGVKQDLVNAPYPDILLQHGFKQIGYGQYAKVWGHPNLDYVLKVFDNKDNAYINWVDVCLQYRNNPCLPKFVSPKIYGLTDKLYYIRMEKLTPAANTYGQLCLEISDAVDKLSTTREDDDEDDNKFNIRHYPSITSYLRKCPSLINTIRLIAELIQQGDGENDVNASNIMLRGDQIVFTDPLMSDW